MDLILDGIRTALRLLASLDSEVLAVTLLSLKISCCATLVSLVLGIPSGTLLALADFPGRRLIVSLVNTGMGLPPVVVGLFVTILLWRNGPLGFLEILYTPWAMIFAQAVIATPIVAGITIASIQKLPPTSSCRCWPWGRPAPRWSGFWSGRRGCRFWQRSWPDLAG